MQHSRTKGSCWAIFAGVLTFVVGCGNGMVPASGKVTFVDGNSLPGSIRVIRFEPAEGTTAAVKKVASGRIDDSGNFSLMTLKPGDGVHPGDYIVTLTVLESPVSGISLIPQQYTTAETSPFEVTVSGAKTDYLFQLEALD